MGNAFGNLQIVDPYDEIEGQRYAQRGYKLVCSILTE